MAFERIAASLAKSGFDLRPKGSPLFAASIDSRLVKSSCVMLPRSTVAW